MTNITMRAVAELPSISMEPFRIILEPAGPVEPKFLNLDQALETARSLAQTGITIQAITQGEKTVLEGSKLQKVLGETRPHFENFPRG